MLKIAFNILIVCSLSAFGEAQESKEDFRKNLSLLLQRTEQSILIVQGQIQENQSAPFLPDLYMQLGELYSTKSSALYYIQMEREGKDSTSGLTVSTKQFSPVTESQKEAIEVYQRLLKEFPKFDRRAKVYYLLSVSLKAIDEVPRFVQTVDKLVKEFPELIETARARLLLGQHLLDKRIFDEAKRALNPVVDSNFTYEKNLAKYRLGLIALAEEKPKDALNLFQQVIEAKDLREEESPAEVSLKTRTVKSNLKREALIDSIRAYTTVYAENPEPVAYYSKIAPNEILFYEVIEKLSYRYITLKKYDVAIKLLRTLSEHTIDPQKVVNIYKDVLVSIPIKDRIDISPEEVRWLLTKRSQWFTFYDIPKNILNESYGFFEKQVRDLATRSHDFGKVEKDPKRKAFYLSRARDYYLMYLGYFRGAKGAVKLAANLADVYFTQGRYLEAGDYYLRAFLGEFGAAKNREELVNNAVASAQKDGEYSFYEQLRIRGILINSVKNYMNLSPKMRKDARLNFILLKTRYEQGYQEESIPKLYSFIKLFPTSKYAVASGELILDFFNSRKDFTGLTEWSNRILTSGMKDQAFLSKVGQIKRQANLKQLDEKVKASGNFDDFSQGKSYLKSALELGDESLRNEALQQALARSKAEKDVDTFFETAKVMASKEKDPSKRSEIRKSVAKENARITRFYQAIGQYQEISNQGSNEERRAAFQESVEVALLLRDWGLITQLARSSQWKEAGDMQNKVRDQLVDLLDSPARLPNGVEDLLARDTSETALLAAYKGQAKLSGGARSRLASQIASLCGAGGSAAVCKWNSLKNIEAEKARVLGNIARAPASIQGVEEGARAFSELTGKYDALVNSGDAHFDIVLALRSAEAYKSFGDYLKNVANQNPQLKEVLMQKANESYTTAKASLNRCREIVANSTVVTPANQFCTQGKTAGLAELTTWRGTRGAQASGSDPKGGEFDALSKQVFSAEQDSGPLLSIATLYLDKGYFNHAAASATLGLSLYPAVEGDFKAVLGCALSKLGLLSEANFHLKKSSDYRGLSKACVTELGAG